MATKINKNITELALLAAVMILPLHALALTILASTISVPVGVNPTSMAYDPLNGYIYVGNSGTTVTVINPATDKVVTNIPVGNPCQRPGLPELPNQTLPVSCNASAGRPTAILYDPGNGYMYVATSTGLVSIISSINNTVLLNVPVGADPVALLYDPGNGYVYVANSASGTVTGISPNVTEVLSIASNHNITNIISKLNTTNITAPPNVTLPSFNARRAFDSSIPAINSTIRARALQLIGKYLVNITVGLNPDALTYDPANNRIYVSNWGSNDVSVIDASDNQVIQVIEGLPGPGSLLYDPGNGYIYVIDAGLVSPSVVDVRYAGVSIIDPAAGSVIGSIMNGVASGLAYDPSNGYIYESIYIGSLINASSGTSRNPFTGANATTWMEVPQANTTAVIGNGDAIVANITTWPNPTSLLYDPMNGYIYVATEETGFLGLGSGGVTVINGRNDTVLWDVITGYDPVSLIYDPSSGYVYALNAGLPGSLGSLSQVYPAGPLKMNNVTFMEEGLPVGARWSVKLARVIGSLSLPTVESTNGSLIRFTVMNGTYDFESSSMNQYQASPAQGTVTINGRNLTITVRFTPLYINFIEEGLAPGTSWAAAVDGESLNSTSSLISFIVHNGTYDYFIQTPPGYAVVNSSMVGTINASRGNATITVRFERIKVNATLVSQYSGYFYSGINLENTFGFYSNETPTAVYGYLNGEELAFNPPSGPNEPWTLQVNMGSLSPGKNTLLVIAKYSLNGAATELTESYSFYVINDPSWLLNIMSYSNLEGVQVKSVTGEAWGNEFEVISTTNLDLGSILSTQVTLPQFAGGGTYDLMPTIYLEIDMYSTGVIKLTGRLTMTTGNLLGSNGTGDEEVDVGPASFTIGVTVGATGDLQVSNGTVNWVSADALLQIRGTASLTMPVAGYSFDVPGYGTVDIGITLTISIAPSTALDLTLAPTEDQGQEFLQGLDLMITRVRGVVEVPMTLAANEGIGVATITEGGSLIFTMSVGPGSPALKSASVTGVVFVQWQALLWSGTIWSEEGVLYSWGQAGSPDPSQPSLITRYYVGPNYDSLRWVNGSWSGAAIADIYPYTTVSIAGEVGGVLILYSNDNSTLPLRMGLQVGGLFMNASRFLTATRPPAVGDALRPAAAAMSNGSVMAAWLYMPYGEAALEGPFNVSFIGAQYAVYTPGRGWGPPHNVTNSGVAGSIVVEGGSNPLIAVLVSRGLMPINASVFIYSPLHNDARRFQVGDVGELEALAGSVLLYRLINGSIEAMNISNGARLPLPINCSTPIVGINVANSSDLLAVLCYNASGDRLVVVNASTLASTYVGNLSSGVEGVAVDYRPPYMVITAYNSTWLGTYLNETPLQGFHAINVTMIGSAALGSSLLIYSLSGGGPAAQQIRNLSLYVVPLSPPPPLKLRATVINATLQLAWREQDAEQYGVRAYLVYVNGTLMAELSNSTMNYSTRVKPGDYVASVAAVNAFGVGEPSVINVSLPLYSVNFTASGIPLGARWGVHVQGSSDMGSINVTLSSSLLSITIQLPRGNYTYIATPPPGFKPITGSINITRSSTILLAMQMNGTTTTAPTITTITPIKPNQGRDYEYSAAIIAIIAIIILAIVVKHRRR